VEEDRAGLGRHMDLKWMNAGREELRSREELAWKDRVLCFLARVSSQGREEMECSD
jgi:hypothetical protein